MDEDNIGRDVEEEERKRVVINKAAEEDDDDNSKGSKGIRQWAEGKTFSGQVKVLTLITSLKLESNADLDFHKITLPLLTPELNILSSISPMHVSPLRFTLLLFATLPVRVKLNKV